MSIFDPLYRTKNVTGQITRSFFYIGQAIQNILWDKSKLEHLTPTQIKAILFVNFLRSDAANINNISKHLNCTPATASGIIDSLENKSLLIRSRFTDDRRKVYLSLTNEGRKLVETLDDLGNDIEEIINDLTVKEKKVLGNIIHKVSNKLIQRNLIQVSDVCISCCYFQKELTPDSEKPHYCEYLQRHLNDFEIFQECPDYRESLN